MVEIYNNVAAAGYEQAFAHVSSHFIPFLLGAGRVAPGQHVLDIATGTGLIAEAALATVGAAGHVTAADLSPDMANRARERLSGASNITIGVEDGQALSFPDASFDTVLCSLGLMFFPIPHAALPSFAACSVRAGAPPSRSTPCQKNPTTRAFISLSPVTCRRWHRRHPVCFRLARKLACGRFSSKRASKMWKLQRDHIVSRCDPLPTTSSTSNGAGDRLVRRSSHFRKKLAMQSAKMLGETSATQEAQSRLKWSSGSPMGEASASRPSIKSEIRQRPNEWRIQWRSRG